jgi:ADP-ribose pyrophosphatase YjhB (NUDIX family)
MYSVGFGGHINSADVVSAFSNYASDPGSTIEIECAARELREELGVDIKTSDDVVLDAGPGSLCTPYVFYDDSSKVSSRHICKALYFKVNDMDSIKAEEDCIKKLTWVPLKELCENMDNMESWSKIVVAYTKEIFDTAQRQKEEEDAYWKVRDVIGKILNEDADLYNKLIVDGDNDALPELTRRVISSDKIVPKSNPKLFETIVAEIVDRWRRAAKNPLKEPQRLGGIIG